MVVRSNFQQYALECIWIMVQSFVVCCSCSTVVLLSLPHPPCMTTNTFWARFRHAGPPNKQGSFPQKKVATRTEASSSNTTTGAAGATTTTTAQQQQQQQQPRNNSNTIKSTAAFSSDAATEQKKSSSRNQSIAPLPFRRARFPFSLHWYVIFCCCGLRSLHVIFVWFQCWSHLAVHSFFLLLLSFLQQRAIRP